MHITNISTTQTHEALAAARTEPTLSIVCEGVKSRTSTLVSNPEAWIGSSFDSTDPESKEIGKGLRMTIDYLERICTSRKATLSQYKALEQIYSVLSS